MNRDPKYEILYSYYIEEENDVTPYTFEEFCDRIDDPDTGDEFLTKLLETIE